jgi:DNA invertase Pin-like site-specific DNA recombinase
MRAVGYCRVSTEEQSREGVSLENQGEKIQAYATIKDLELIEIIVDAGISAKTLERSGIRRILEILHQGEARALIVYKLDRLTRSTKDLLSLVYDLFIPENVTLHSICETLDTSTANGRFFLTMLGGIATWERETIAERTKDALSYKKRNGEWAAGRIPYGFRLNGGGQLEEHPDQIAMIRKAKRLKRRGRSIREISERLEISKSVVHRLLNDNLRSRKTRYIKGKGRRTVP